MSFRARAGPPGGEDGERDDHGPRSGFPGELTPHKARTDSAGRATLSSYPGEAARLVVRAAGFAPHSSAALKLPSSGSFEQTLHLAPGATAVVTVIDMDEAPAAGFLVEHHRPIPDELLLGPPGDEDGVRTNLDGRAKFAHLEPGLHHFRVREDEPSASGMTFRMAGAPGGPPVGEGWEAVEVGAGDELEVELALSPRGALSGTVTEGGEPLAGAKVTLIRKTDESVPRLPGTSPEAATSSRGRYAFDSVRAGRYRLEVAHGTRALPSGFDIEIEEGDEDFDVDLPITSVAGRVADAQNEPVVGAKVRAVPKEGGGPRMNMVMIGMVGGGPNVVSVSDGRAEDGTATTDEEGRFVLRGLPTDLDLCVEASAEDWPPATSKPFRLNAGESREHADVALVPGGSLRVRGELADYPAGLMVLATFEGAGDARPQPKLALLEEGEALFTGLLEGSWRVQVQPMGPAPEGAPELPDAQVVTIEGGKEAQADFHLP